MGLHPQPAPYQFHHGQQVMPSSMMLAPQLQNNASYLPINHPSYLVGAPKIPRANFRVVVDVHLVEGGW
jgi:hypothetical protein